MTIVRTQAELDAALADAKANPTRWREIEVRSERGVWLTIREACDNATVRAYGSATVAASGNATVTAYDNATVRAYGSATVTAYDNATVRAYGSATVTAYDNATVTAGTKVAVHLFSARANITGGVVIDVSKPTLDPREWCAEQGVEVSGAGVATLYKAVTSDYLSSWGQSYSPGSKPECKDWRDNNECGNGFHFSPTPDQALAYASEATRFLAAGVKVADLRPIPGGTAKCKAPRVVRACREVDIAGKPIKSEVSA